ncbi:MAG: hypothetical protein CEE43_02215 [Promethearchaeota archaeon Loki_b32]|nr:MAG: hypothetical protein CEE43_02215 [Candidatus Lokiarchaeota archaeon Loki_b32]
MTLELEIVKPSDNLKKYLELEKIDLHTLADAYLEISRSLYELLADYPSELGELRKGYRDLMKLIKYIQKKETDTADYKPQNIKWRESVHNNKDHLLKNITIYLSIMQELKEHKLNLVLGIIAMVISGVSLILSILAIVLGFSS